MPPPSEKPVLIVHWIARIVAAGILAIGALPKFTGGAEALAERLPGGGLTAVLIGVMEVTAIVLMFVPRTTMAGSGLAAVIMLGAIVSHLAGPVGMDGEFAAMFAMAIVAFLASVVATAAAWWRARPKP